MFVLTGLLALGAALLLLPTVADLAARTRTGRRARRAFRPLSELPRFLFLVPAHDEELLVASCVRSLTALAYPGDRLAVVVVADNCHDRTASLARAAGVTCLEREVPALPGKPQAIAWALAHLPWRHFDAVVVVDADSVVHRYFAAALAATGGWRDRAGQGYHEVLNREDSAWTRLGALVGAANHRFAYPVKQRGDLNTPLLGNGMVIGTDLLTRHGWPALGICEDWEMYAALTIHGERIDGVPEARVASQEARTLAQSTSQRRRWTAGKLTVCLRYAGRILRSPAIDPVQKLDAIAELSAPGPALHLAIVALAILVGLLVPLPAAGAVVTLYLTSLVRPAWYVSRALRVDPTPGATLRALLLLPAYVIWRAAVALGALTMLGDRPWIRTARHLSPRAAPSTPPP